MSQAGGIVMWYHPIREQRVRKGQESVPSGRSLCDLCSNDTPWTRTPSPAAQAERDKHEKEPKRHQGQNR